MRIKQPVVLLALIATVLSALCCSAVLAQDQQNSKSDQDSIKLNATLVQVPTVVTNRQGAMVTDLSQANFKVFEDGKEQQIGTFATVQQPFNVVLVLDTSNTAEDRLKAIQNTAVDFVKQLTADDRAMVINFDDDIHQLTDFTADKSELETAIRGTESGFGKLLYEAVKRALDQLKTVDGRRAVIVFSDGVDLGSVDATAASTEQLAQEVGAVIYCVKFNTRWWVDAAARKQQKEHPYNSSTFPTDGRIPLPPIGSGSPQGMPNGQGPRVTMETSGGIGVSVTDANAPQDITKTLDKLYGTADEYTQTLSTGSGGKTFETQGVSDTQKAFADISKELRSQYVIGYYPASNHLDGKLHKIKVQVDRKDLQVRARQGYRASPLEK